MAVPQQGNIKILCDRSFSVTNWFVTVLRAIPVMLRQAVIFKLVQALLQVRLTRSEIGTGHMQLSPGRPNQLVVGRTSYHISDAPQLRHLRTCKEALRRKHRPVLVVPKYAIHRAHRLRHLAGLQSQVQIVSLETLLAVDIVFEAARRGRTIPDMWEGLISEYNRGVQDTAYPEIILEWCK